MSANAQMRMTAVLLAGLALWGCGSKKGESETETAPTPVETEEATRGPIQRIVTADAVLYPVAQSGVTPKISAPVRRFLVNRGDHVRAGQLLAELENRDLVSAVNESKALYEQSEAQFLTITKGTLPEDATRARTDVASAAQARDAAKTLYENRVTLVRQGALAQKLADDAKVAMVQAQSALDNAERHLESLNSVSRTEQIRGAQSQVDASKARLGSAEAQLSYSEIRSPMAGIVADRPANAGEMATSGNALIDIVDISEVVARANVPVRDTQYLKVGDVATIAAPDGELTGKVTVVSPAVDPASTTVEVWIRARNPNEKLKPGVTAKVSIQARTIPDAVLAPAAALLASDEGANEVMVVGTDSLAHETKVETGIRQGDRVQIIDGLKGGERVVTVGGVGLADQSKVEVQRNDGAKKRE